MALTAVQPAAIPDAVAGPSATRLLSLDVLRGVAVAGMILVTDPGTYSAVYPPLLHADWQGWTPTDMIFPTFLWIVGAAVPFSMAAQERRGAGGPAIVLRILRRGCLLILLGLLLNGFPFFHLHTLRLPGVLQRIALCYSASALLMLWIGRRNISRARQALLAGGCAVGSWCAYGLLLAFVPVPGFGPGHLDQLRSLPAYLDRLLFTRAHLWPYGIAPGYGVAFDPEGLLSTVPALGTTLAGAAAGVWLRAARNWRQTALSLAGAGVCCMCAGYALAPWQPMIKKLWTPSFAVFAAGVSLLVFAALYALLDGVRAGRRPSAPFVLFGTNAILAFTFSGMLTASLQAIEAQPGRPLHAWLYERLFATWLRPVHASLLYAVCIVLVNGFLLLPFYRRRLFLRF